MAASLPLAALADLPPVTTEMAVVFVLVAVTLVLFVTEALPLDVTAILVMVTLMVLQPWTDIGVAEGLSGFSNPATITVLAMLILSNGVSRSGVVQILGRWMSAFAGTNKHRQLASTILATGPASGFINNTPVVAILVPVISDLAHKGGTSPSKLLMPLSFASMLGGMLTLIGTSTNILASQTAERIGAERGVEALHAFSMFEFTHLGAIVLVVGAAYLMTIGYWLLPERVPPEDDYLAEYEMQDYLSEVIVQASSPLVGKTVSEAIDERRFDADVLQLVRGGERFIEPIGQKVIKPGDVLTIRTDRETLAAIADVDDLALTGAPETDPEMEPTTEEEQTLVELVIQSGSPLVGETLRSSSFRGRYDANVLAFRSRGETVRQRMDERKLRVGDTLLIQAPEDSIDRLSQSPDFILGHEPEEPDYRTEKIPYAVATIVGVVAAATLLPVNIVVSALAGVVAMVATGVLHPGELYESVDWNVIFLLAGVIPLGIALEQTGGAELLGALVAATGQFLPAVGVLWVFYVATSLITGVISNNASVVLMIPVAVEAALEVGANPFAFVLAVTFAASTAFMTPVGYQTNLFVYGPGGYKFGDYVRVGMPLQLLLSVVTVAGIAAFWPL
ncbi:SLC13 family permease [Halobacterium sp. CBA1126]|uniref:SLC13 family permease n=1 Tax=Halobacterium sp. CBA1126 TaxID=2668074 RepID=UPI0012F75532|nr:SLC13 family permease [Halobacterium sp. CBA1126]MUV61238.1 SLC13 family permease [Halobacterium sp. CBA1126]